MKTDKEISFLVKKILTALPVDNYIVDKSYSLEEIFEQLQKNFEIDFEFDEFVTATQPSRMAGYYGVFNYKSNFDLNNIDILKTKYGTNLSILKFKQFIKSERFLALPNPHVCHGKSFSFYFKDISNFKFGRSHLPPNSKIKFYTTKAVGITWINLDHRYFVQSFPQDLYETLKIYLEN